MSAAHTLQCRWMFVLCCIRYKYNMVFECLTADLKQVYGGVEGWGVPSGAFIHVWHPKSVCISNVEAETNGQPAANPSSCIRDRERWWWCVCSSSSSAFPFYLRGSVVPPASFRPSHSFWRQPSLTKLARWWSCWPLQTPHMCFPTAVSQQRSEPCPKPICSLTNTENTLITTNTCVLIETM